MFTSPASTHGPQTPARNASWPRYNPAPSIPPSTPISSLTHQLSLSFDHQSQTDSAYKVITQDNDDHNDNEIDDQTPPSSASPVIETPFVFRNNAYSIDPLASPPTPTTRSTSTPAIMGHYPDTPSPPSAYGINGGVIVGQHAGMMG
jgi:hypothetical protein